MSLAALFSEQRGFAGSAFFAIVLQVAYYSVS